MRKTLVVEEVLEKLFKLDRTDSAKNRISSSFVSAVPMQKTRGAPSGFAI